MAQSTRYFLFYLGVTLLAIGPLAYHKFLHGGGSELFLFVSISAVISTIIWWLIRDSRDKSSPHPQELLAGLVFTVALIFVLGTCTLFYAGPASYHTVLVDNQNHTRILSFASLLDDPLGAMLYNPLATKKIVRIKEAFEVQEQLNNPPPGSNQLIFIVRVKFQITPELARELALRGQTELDQKTQKKIIDIVRRNFIEIVPGKRPIGTFKRELAQVKDVRLVDLKVSSHLP